jgi:hypothetical protein
MNLTAIKSLETAVETGATYLDARYAGWRWRVNLDVFEAVCLEHSITGQLFGESLADQMRGVGIDLSWDEPWVTVRAFCDMGFSLMSMTPFVPSETMRAEAMAQGIELPPVIPIERDPDVCTMEREALQMLWEREISKR